LGAFWCQGLIDVTAEVKNDIGTFQKYYGLNSEQKKEVLIGDLYRLAQQCQEVIPEKDNIIVVTDHANTSLYLSYYLTPRKIYLPDLPDDKRQQQLPDIDAFDSAWLKKKNIKWVVCCFTQKSKQNKIVRIRNYTTYDESH